MKNLVALPLIIFIAISCNDNSPAVKTTETKDSVQRLLNSFRDSIRKHPNDTSLKFEFIVALQEAGQYREAINFLDSMSLRWGDSANMKVYFNGLFKRAELLAQDGDTVNAIKSLEFFVIPGELTEAGLQLANLYAETKNPKVLAICDSMIKNDESKRDPNPDYLKGVYYYNIGDYDKALQQFNSSINKDYTFLDAYMEKGRILYKQARYSEAIAIYDLAIKVSNTFADAWFWKGKSQEALRQKEEAKISYQRAYAFDKTLIEAKEAAERISN
ncbi:MAG TPA: tetratricopeptide repeat protein [Chitinophagaceae bacterium]|nr:tetratricopeptide repeat protein [Chitinophagaceae bacterium]